MSNNFLPIASVVNPRNGAVTLYLNGTTSGGPVVTGKNLAEAKTKFQEAYGLMMIARDITVTV
jgi:hypothetical protein